MKGIFTATLIGGLIFTALTACTNDKKDDRDQQHNPTFTDTDPDGANEDGAYMDQGGPAGKDYPGSSGGSGVNKDTTGEGTEHEH